MANLSNLEPNPDRHEHYDVVRSRPNPLVTFVSYLVGILLALIVLYCLYMTVTTGNGAAVVKP
jgi:hypothetical protein